MAFTTADLIDAIKHSRRHFLKHLDGLTPEQYEWKPYPECKSIRETLAHLIVDDMAAMESMQKPGDPDYEGLSNKVASENGDDVSKLRSALERSHSELVSFLTSRYGDASLDQEVTLWGDSLKLGRALAYLTAEDFYHAGQVAFVRMATDPGWDYYASVYGG